MAQPRDFGFGDEERARAAAEEVVAETVRSGARLFELDARIARAAVAVRTGDRATAESEFEKIERLIEETGVRIRLPTVHELRAELARTDGDEAASERELREAHRLFSEMGATGHAERVEGMLSS